MKKLLVVGLLASGSCVYASEGETPAQKAQTEEDIFAKFETLSLNRDAAVAAHGQTKTQLKAAQQELKQKQLEWELKNKAATEAGIKKADAACKVETLKSEETKAHQASRETRRERNAQVADFNVAAKDYNKNCWTRATTYSLQQEEAVSEDEVEEVKPAQEKQEEKINPAKERQETYAGKAKEQRKKSNK